MLNFKYSAAKDFQTNKIKFLSVVKHILLKPQV